MSATGISVVDTAAAPRSFARLPATNRLPNWPTVTYHHPGPAERSRLHGRLPAVELTLLVAPAFGGITGGDGAIGMVGKPIPGLFVLGCRPPPAVSGRVERQESAAAYEARLADIGDSVHWTRLSVRSDIVGPSRRRETNSPRITRRSGFGALRPLRGLRRTSPVESDSERSARVGGTAQSAPNVWTGCFSQLRACGRKSLICIRPVDRHAGRGLDGNTHAPLISLADRLPCSH